MTKRPDPSPRVTVYAECVTDWITDRVKVVDCAEDIEGHDVVTYVCPHCQQQHTSKVRIPRRTR